MKLLLSVPVLCLFACVVSCGAPAEDTSETELETSQALKSGKPEKGGDKDKHDKKDKKDKKDKDHDHDHGDCDGGHGGKSGSGGAGGGHGGSGGIGGSGGSGGTCPPSTGLACGCFDRQTGVQPGRFTCDGQCSSPPTPIFDECDACGGSVFCDGSCSVAIPAEYGQPCGGCGGTVQCNGLCSIPCNE